MHREIKSRRWPIPALMFCHVLSWQAIGCTRLMFACMLTSKCAFFCFLGLASLWILQPPFPYSRRRRIFQERETQRWGPKCGPVSPRLGMSRPFNELDTVFSLSLSPPLSTYLSISIVLYLSDWLIDSFSFLLLTRRPLRVCGWGKRELKTHFRPRPGLQQLERKVIWTSRYRKVYVRVCVCVVCREFDNLSVSAWLWSDISQS